MKYKKNKNIFILLFLLFLILGIRFGYSYLSTTLDIKGITGINNVQWDIYFENIQVSTGSVEATIPAKIDDSKTSISYAIILEKPGDYYEFTVDAVNNGSLDGMIENISFKLNGIEISSLPEYLEYNVSYLSGNNLKVNNLLKSFSSQTYKVRIEFKENIIADQLPSEKKDFNFNFKITYRQANNKT